MQRLQVSDNGRFLVYEDGMPFFWLADTAWELIHRLNRDELATYLDDRASKGFTAIQTVILAEIRGITTPNAYGDLPLHDGDISKPNEAYFQHVDFFVAACRKRGLYAAILPTWGAYAVEERHPLFPDHFLLRPDTAEPYGKFLGERYASADNIVWVFGGDRKPNGYEQTWRMLAQGIRAKDDQSLITFHPRGAYSSGEDLHGEQWLDFNMVQSGHQRSMGHLYRLVTGDFERTPPKPVVNGEPAYEGIRNGVFDDTIPTEQKSRIDDRDIRRQAYHSVFLGACGHTYGCNEIWMMYSPDLEPYSELVQPPFLDAEMPWYEAIQRPGSGQLRHLKDLMLSRPFLSRERLPDAVREGRGIATGDRGTYMFVYGEGTEPVQVSTGTLGPSIELTWMDPETGQQTPGGQHYAAGTLRLVPRSDRDWVAILDAVP